MTHEKERVDIASGAAHSEKEAEAKPESALCLLYGGGSSVTDTRGGGKDLRVILWCTGADFAPRKLTAVTEIVICTSTGKM
jgi:hypothetical protein